MVEYEICEKKLNIKQTLLANVFYVAFLILPVSFFIMGVEASKNIDESYGAAMIVIFSLFFIMKMLMFMGQPQFVYEETWKKIIRRKK